MSPLLLVPFALIALIGLAFGSFGNVLLVRIAEGSRVTGRSRCPKCRHQLVWYDLVPVVSYMLLHGRCRFCKKPISSLYPLVETASAALFLLAAVLGGDSLVLMIGYALFLWGLLLAAVYDAKSGLLPDLLTIIVASGALIIALHEHALVPGLIGVLIGGGWFGLQWILTRGRAVGSGDILLAGSIGLALGTWGTVTMLVVSYIVGAMVAVILLFMKRASRGSQIPFGPFLAIGTLLTLLGMGSLYMAILTRTY